MLVYILLNICCMHIYREVKVLALLLLGLLVLLLLLLLLLLKVAFLDF